MKGLSTRQAAKALGITHAALSRYISRKKIPSPKTIVAGGMKVHLWTEAEIAHVRSLLPKIANGRKTRRKKLREESPEPQPRAAALQEKAKKKTSKKKEKKKT